ncbi:MAG: hypothetical protein HYV32_01455 [Candidatus Kerfeldbacteria bacterium]|nr:hypothetical protein [Candidatus Kerfeldbacteria bacterium]
MKKIFFLTLLPLFSLVFFGCSPKAQFHTFGEWIGFAKDIKVSLTDTNEQHTVIVPGYGAPVKGNVGYEGYIKKVVAYVTDEQNGVDAVVFTGSYSSLKDTSEAESMNAYFNSIVDTKQLLDRGVRIYKEECAIVSWQNIDNSQELLTQAKITPDKITVFGDINREDKLVAFANVAFNKNKDLPNTAAELVNKSLVTTVDFYGYDFGGASEDEQKRNAKFAAEIAGATNPEIGNQILQARINEWTQEFGYDVAANVVAKGCSEYAGFQ